MILALRNTERSGLRRRLAAIAADTAGHVAWLCHELNDYRGATRYYAISAMVIRQPGDPGLDAYVQGFKSQVWYRRGDFQQARLLAEDASRKATRGGGATLRSWLWALRGQVLAELGDATGCVAALAKAEARSVWRAPSRTRHGWTPSIPAGSPPWRAPCYRKLGQLQAAEELLHMAMTQLDPSGTRRRGMVLLELALVEGKLAKA